MRAFIGMLIGLAAAAAIAVGTAVVVSRSATSTAPDILARFSQTYSQVGNGSCFEWKLRVEANAIDYACTRPAPIQAKARVPVPVARTEAKAPEVTP